MLLSVSDVIRKWGSDGALARDIELDRDTVKKWRQRKSIPGEYWLSIENAARRRGVENVTVFVLAEIADRAREGRVKEAAHQ